MIVYGCDFTSAPSKRKPLTLVSGTLTDERLCIDGAEALPGFTDFEAFLKRGGPWAAGFDFPFGQPLKLIHNLNLPQTWAGYVELIAAMDKREWVARVEAYMAPRAYGDKLHFRQVDRLAGAQSPMKMSFIPTGRMFYEGAPRLLASGVSVIPNHPTGSDRLAFEVYPALVAREFVGRGSGYKSDDIAKQTDKATAKRAAILDGLLTACANVYGFRLSVPGDLQDAFINDPTGDHLDAMLAAVQAAWAVSQRDDNYGVPLGVSPLEGWITDPALVRKDPQ
jgi:hypothetical protein